MLVMKNENKEHLCKAFISAATIQISDLQIFMDTHFAI